MLFTKLTKISQVQNSVVLQEFLFRCHFIAIHSLQEVPDLKFKVHDHTTQVFLNCFCLFLPRHLVIFACRLGEHCRGPLQANSHVINEFRLRNWYPYSATVRMSCDYGHERTEGSYALRCLHNGWWNDTSLRCKRK